MKQNYKLEICYDGTRYHGWEKKDAKDTIQGKLESVLSKMTGETVSVIGAGRTDAGVHAKAMVASVVLDTDFTELEIQSYMNRYLPEDIGVQDVKIAAERFHARYRAVGKTYRYTCYCGAAKPVFQRRYVTTLEYQPDVDKMRKAAAYLVGEHDFASFCSRAKMKKSTVRVLDSIEIEARKGFVYFTFHGDGFLYNMVRILVGTLLEVGKGNLEPEQVRRILESKNRQLAGPTAPPQGLCLEKIDY